MHGIVVGEGFDLGKDWELSIDAKLGQNFSNDFTTLFQLTSDSAKAFEDGNRVPAALVNAGTNGSCFFVRF